MLARLLLCCLVAVAGFIAATSLSVDGSNAAASPVASASTSAVGVVASVVDGDTLVVRFPGGKRDRIRVLGIDSPEMQPRERCAIQATAAARRLAQGKTVTLLGDRTQAARDRFRRLLAYVTLPGGSDLGRRLVATGYAKVYVVGGRPFLRVGSYRAAEKAARAKRFGLWGDCSTLTTVIPVPVPKPAPPKAPTTPVPTTTTVAPIAPIIPTVPTVPTTTGTTTTTPPTPTYACSNGADDDGDGKVDYPADPGCTSSSDTDEADPPPPSSNCHASYPDFCIAPPPPDKDCGDFSQKNFRVDHSVSNPDPHRLDGNQDGRACEN